MKPELKEKSELLINLCLCLVVMLLVAAFCGKYMSASDFGAALKWWFGLLLLSLAFIPLTIILFKRFYDNGWIFSKSLGIAVSGWFLWYLSSFKIMRFTRNACIVSVLICLIVNIGVFVLYNRYSRSKVNILKAFSLKKIGSMAGAEALFFCLFMLFCYIKGYNPKAYGTEKFMDFGFITAMLKSEYMPPHDMWLSGNSINYYYVGQYMSAYLIKLFGTGAGYGYNLMMMTLASLAFSMSYSVTSNVMLSEIRERVSGKSRKFLMRLTGILAGLGITFAGNMHYPIYKWIMPKIRMIKGEEAKNYWFSDSTRFIGYDPDIQDKTIHEYPAYSFVLGDLHAHVINIIFVLTVIALLFAWLLGRKKMMKVIKEYDGNPMPAEDDENYGKRVGIKDLLREIAAPQIIMCMFFIGLFHTTNYWDFPIYFVVCGGVILFSNLRTYRYKNEAFILTAMMAAAFIIVWNLVALPFTLSFDSIATSVKFCDRHTSLYQLLVLWGLPVLLVTSLTVKKVIDALRNKEQSFFPAFFDGLSTGELFTITIGLSAMGLVLLPEIIYVQDIYGGAYQRSNTMFKLTYQAFIMFSMAMSIIIVKFLYFKASKALKTIGTIGIVCFFATVCYIFEANNVWFTGYYKTLDASAFLKDESPQDYAGIKWINENVEDDAVVLEMCGLSYTFFNRVSVFTGNSTVLGWQTHEWLWRSSGEKEYPPEITERHSDIVNIYTSNDVELVRSLIAKYGIDYIYVGGAEHFDGYFSMTGSTQDGGSYHTGTYRKIRPNNALLQMLGDVYYVDETDVNEGSYTYIVKIDPDKVIDEKTIGSNGVIEHHNAMPMPAKIEYEYEKEDFAGNKITATAYEYNEFGLVKKEENYNAQGEIVSYSEYTYTSSRPTFRSDYLIDGSRYSFWNYVDFDSEGRCTLAHCFLDDNTWLRSVTTTYNTDSTVYSENIRYSEGYNRLTNYSYTNGLPDKAAVTFDNGEAELEYDFIIAGSSVTGVRIFIKDTGALYGTENYEY